MRRLRFATFNLALVFTTLTVAQGQSTLSSGSVENVLTGMECTNSSNKNGSTKAGCAYSSVDQLGDTGQGAASASASYSNLQTSGSTSVAEVSDGQEQIYDVSAAAQINDGLTVGNFVSGSYVFVAAALASAPGGDGYSSISLQVNLGNLPLCNVGNFGKQGCSGKMLVGNSNGLPLVVTIGGVASAVCDTTDGSACESAASFSAAAPAGVEMLVIQVLDSAGNPEKGATITASSGHKYPNHFASTTMLTSSPNPSVQGDPVKFKAAITSFGRPGTPTGEVVFVDSTTGTTLGQVRLKAGVASLTTSSLPAGTDTITATYGGDEWSASSHATVSQVVN